MLGDPAAHWSPPMLSHYSRVLLAMAPMVLCAALTPTALATPPPPGQLAPAATRPSPAAVEPADPKIAALISQLGDAEFERREAAQKQLVALGPAVLAALKAAATGADAERKDRANRAIDQIIKDQKVRHWSELMDAVLWQPPPSRNWTIHRFGCPSAPWPKGRAWRPKFPPFPRHNL
jgi:hypothetical protein